jgi:hypothetical protein
MYILNNVINISLAFQFTYTYFGSPLITGPTCDFLCGHPAVLAKGGKRAMVMKSRERWHCVNPACGCVVLVESNGEIEGQNPRCACGSIMPAFIHRDSSED